MKVLEVVELAFLSCSEVTNSGQNMLVAIPVNIHWDEQNCKPFQKALEFSAKRDALMWETEKLRLWPLLSMLKLLQNS